MPRCVSIGGRRSAALAAMQSDIVGSDIGGVPPIEDSFWRPVIPVAGRPFGSSLSIGGVQGPPVALQAHQSATTMLPVVNPAIDTSRTKNSATVALR